MNSIYIFGDICPRWGDGRLFNTRDARCVFNNIVDLYDEKDIVITNLEAPTTTSTEPLPKSSMNLKAKPDDAGVLKQAGISGCALANNHILDYGVKGLEDTINNLNEIGIHGYGVVKDNEENKPFPFEINGLRVCVLAFAEHEFNCATDYGYGAALWDDLDSINLIRKTKNECDYLLIQYHGGIEHYRIPSPTLQKRCRAMVEAGADFVTCQHSHCVGTRETWKGAEILYGQGNCIFGYEKDRPMWNTGLVAKIAFENKEAKIEYIPIISKENGHYLMEGNEAKNFLLDFEQLSSQIHDPEFVKKNWIKFCKEKKDSYLPMMYAHGRIYNKLNRLTKGLIISSLTKRNGRRNAMNLLRCDAHREVVTTLHELDFYK